MEASDRHTIKQVLRTNRTAKRSRPGALSQNPTFQLDEVLVADMADATGIGPAP
jgi:hypothetical protein